MHLKAISLVLAAAGWLASGQAGASGFALIEQSASGLGNAYAGGAAAAEDASTIFFNPAGMGNIKGRQLAVALHVIRPSAKFANANSTGALGNVPGGDAGNWAYVPNFYYLADLNPQWKYGLGINSPFGLKTEYNPTWMGRFHAIKSEIQTININPSVSYKISDDVTLGAGISAQYIKGELTSQTAASGVLAVKGTDWSYGANFGALFQAGNTTRVGVAYRSAISHNLTGDAIFSGNAALNGPATLDIKMPDTLSLSFLSQVDPKWELMGDLTWTKWSVFRELAIYKSGALLGGTAKPENWRDTYRVSVGASHRYNDQWKSRIGVAYDQTPVSDQYRTARIPDSDRTWLALGLSYKVSTAGTLDLGYAHLFMKDATINETLTGPLTLNGIYNNDVNIVSAQYTHNF